MYAMTQIRIHKGVVQWQQGLHVEVFSRLQYDTNTFGDLFADVRNVCRPL